MTALYLLEPSEPGADVGPVRRRAADRRAPRRRVARARALGGGRATREATAILGAHVDGFHEATTPPVRAAGADRRPRDRGRLDCSRPPATACRLDSAPRYGGCSIAATTVGWIVAAGRAVGRARTSGATRSRSTGCCSAAASIS